MRNSTIKPPGRPPAKDMVCIPGSTFLMGSDPTKAEWEFAAWGGRDYAEFAWGDELTPSGQNDGEHLAGRVFLGELENRWR